MIRTPQGPGRKISECITLAKAHEEKLGYAPVPDPDLLTKNNQIAQRTAVSDDDHEV